MTALLGFVALALLAVALVTWLPFGLILVVLLALYLWVEWLPKPGEDFTRED